METVDLHWCGRCKKEKPATTEYFVKSKNTKSGLGTMCRDCHKARMKVDNKQRYESNPARVMIKAYARFDELAGREFDLDEEWFKDNILSKPCSYCGTVDGNIGADRVDNSIGHTKYNVIPACGTCNKVRNVFFSVPEMKIIGAAIAEVMRGRK